MDLTRLVRFATVGGCGFIVDAGMTELLVHFGSGAYVARVVAIAAAIAVTYGLNRRLTWKSTARGRDAAAEIGRYLAVALSTAAVNYLIYAGLVLAMPGLRPALAVGIASGIAMVMSYLGYGRLVFSRGKALNG